MDGSCGLGPDASAASTAAPGSPVSPGSTGEPGGRYAAVLDPRFFELWRMVNDRLVTWGEFEGLQMPEGASAEEVWQVLAELRRCSGAVLGPSRDRLERHWVNLPGREQRAAQEIVNRCSAKADVAAYLDAVPFEEAYPEGRVGEALYLLSRDGIRTDYETVRSIIRHRRRPRSDAERVVGNYSQVIEDEFRRAAGPPLTAVALYERMVGASPDVVGANVLANLDACLAGARGVRGTEALSHASYMWVAAKNLRLVGAWNSLFSSVLIKVYLIRSGLPALSLLPLLDEGAFAVCTPEEVGGRLDMTDVDIAFLQCVDLRLGRLEAAVADRATRIADLGAAVEGAASLNYRQQEVLLAALADGRRAFDYGGVASKYQVAYNTARADLNALANSGLLYTTNDGRKLDFHPVPDFADALEAWLYR